MTRKQQNRPTKEVKNEEPEEEAEEEEGPAEEVEEEEVEEEAEEVVEAPKKKAGKAAAPRKTATAKRAPKPVEETPKKGAGKGKAPAAKKTASRKTEPVGEEQEKEKPVRRSRTVTKEDILKKYEELAQVLDDEIERLRTQQDKGTKGKGVGIQYLRGLKKRVRELENSTNRVMKQKQKTPRKNNNSGFLKPVLISKEMASFTGWDPSKETSRVDVTRFLCDYIKSNDLQNPQDRRQIFADDKLSRLLKYDAKKNEPLTYYSMQRFMKPHFQRPEVAAA